MQTLNQISQNPAALLMADDIEFEFAEPKRLVISPLEVCLLSRDEDLFEDD